MKKNIKLVVSIVMGVSCMALAITWYDWKLALIIFLALWANNIGDTE